MCMSETSKCKLLLRKFTINVAIMVLAKALSPWMPAGESSAYRT